MQSVCRKVVLDYIGAVAIGATVILGGCGQDNKWQNRNDRDPFGAGANAVSVVTSDGYQFGFKCESKEKYSLFYLTTESYPNAPYVKYQVSATLKILVDSLPVENLKIVGADNSNGKYLREDSRNKKNVSSRIEKPFTLVCAERQKTLASAKRETSATALQGMHSASDLPASTIYVTTWAISVRCAAFGQMSPPFPATLLRCGRGLAAAGWRDQSGLPPRREIPIADDSDSAMLLDPAGAIAAHWPTGGRLPVGTSIIGGTIMTHAVAGTRPRVVIVGAGFGGLSAATTLANTSFDVTLIDRHNYHLFQPLLHQVATAGLSPSDIASPIRGIMRNAANVNVVLG